MERLSCVATCALGLEGLLAEELRSLGLDTAVAVGPAGKADRLQDKGAVRFLGNWSDCRRANLWLRTANRVLVELANWSAGTDDELERGARALVAADSRWCGVGIDDLLDPRFSFALRATTSRSRLTDSRWVSLKVKDGLVDGQRQRFGRRASIDRKRPDLPLRVWLADDHATLLVDTSREPLDRRGYRVARTEAPMRETLAAACIMASGFEGEGPVVDPMCGSGTLLIEAGLIALGWPPSRLRASWVFDSWPWMPATEPDRKGNEPQRAPELYGFDRSQQAIDATKRNLDRAGLLQHATIEPGDAFRVDPPPAPGLVAVNPPYGGRLVSDRDFWKKLGDLLKSRYRGYRAVVLAGDEGKGKWIGLRPHKRLAVHNGPIAARILVFDLY